MNEHKMFNVTSVCIGDVIQMIEDSNIDDLRKAFLIKRAKELKSHEMKWFSKKLADGFCNCCFWDILRDLFEQIVEDDKLNKNGGKK